MGRTRCKRAIVTGIVSCYIGSVGVSRGDAWLWLVQSRAEAAAARRTRTQWGLGTCSTGEGYLEQWLGKFYGGIRA